MTGLEVGKYFAVGIIHLATDVDMATVFQTGFEGYAGGKAFDKRSPFGIEPQRQLRATALFKIIHPRYPGTLTHHLYVIASGLGGAVVYRKDPRKGGATLLVEAVGKFGTKKKCRFLFFVGMSNVPEV